MKAYPKITTLGAPPEVGRRYMVPTVTYPWLRSKVRAWPVFPNLHDDAEHLKFPHTHYHVDPRFLTEAEVRMVARYNAWGTAPADRDWYAEACAGSQRFPQLSRALGGRSVVDGYPVRADGHYLHPRPVWRVKVCRRAEVRYFHGGAPTIRAMHGAFEGAQCASSKSGWMCPHKRYPLGNVAADAAGVITCPLHGLRVDAATGKVLGGASA